MNQQRTSDLPLLQLYRCTTFELYSNDLSSFLHHTRHQAQELLPLRQWCLLSVHCLQLVLGLIQFEIELPTICFQLLNVFLRFFIILQLYSAFLFEGFCL